MHRTTAIALVCVVLAWTTGGLAQQAADPGQQLARDMARQQFEAGVEASEQGRWRDALHAFKRSHELSGQPLVLLNLAAAQVETGDLLGAAESYRLFLADSAPQAQANFRAQTEEALAALENRIPRIRIAVTGLQPSDELRVDDQAIEHDRLTDLALNPGTYRVAVTREGNTVATDQVELAEGARRDLALDARLGRVRETDDPDPDLVDPDPEPEPDRGGILRSPIFWTVVGVVVVGAAVGTGIALTRGGGSGPEFVGNLEPGRWEAR